MDLPESDRGSFLVRECAGDTALVEEVQSLLAHDEGEESLGDFVRQVAADLMENQEILGQRAGAYRIISELGRGGMGAVYRAVRADDEFNKEVAIKVVKRGMDTDAMLERFRQERQILARLDHSYIGKLLDGGSICGQPYFVMELVDGVPVDTYCRTNNLPIEDCCQLFLKICEGVTYAHQNLVIHRDLKPGNILVNAAGVPKLLDFGLAKLLSTDPESALSVTLAMNRMMTPEYASPEHIQGRPATTATDIYALAAILYELVGGGRTHPLPADRPDEWEKIICEQEVARFTGKLKRQAGDLETVLLMALRKEPERRYASVDQFAADIQRYLNRQPVRAREDTAGYRMARFVRRNRILVAATTAVAVSLTGGTVISVRQMQRAEEHSRQAEAARMVAERERLLAAEQRKLAETEAATAHEQEERANQHLTQLLDLSNRSLFDIHSDIEELPGSTGARRKLVQTTLTFLEGLAKQSGTDERLQLALGAAYHRIGDIQGRPNSASLGESAAAMVSYERAESFVRPHLNGQHHTDMALPLWVDIRCSKARVLNATGQVAEAAQMVREVLPSIASLAPRGRASLQMANAKSLLFFILQFSEPAEALRLGVQSLAEFEQFNRENPKDLRGLSGQATVESQIGGAYRRLEEHRTALAHLRQAERLQEKLTVLEPNNTRVQRELLIIYGKIATVLEDAGNANRDIQMARAYYFKARGIAVTLNKIDPLNRLAQYDLAMVESRLGGGATAIPDRAEALAMLERAAAKFEVLAKAEPKTLRYKTAWALSRRAAGENLGRAGKVPEATAAYREALTEIEAVLAVQPEDNISTIQALSVEHAMARLLARNGNWAEGQEWARRALRRAKAHRDHGRPGSKNALAGAYMVLAELEREFGSGKAACESAEMATAIWRDLAGADEARAWAANEARAKEMLGGCNVTQ